MSLKSFKPIFFFLILFILTSSGFAQSISFQHPANGATITGSDVTGQSSVPVPVTIGSSGGGSSSFIMLITETQTYNSRSGSIPTHIYLTPGTYNWRAELWQYVPGLGDVKLATAYTTFNVRYKVFTNVNFYGNLSVDGGTVSSGSSVNKLIGENISLGAIDQTNGNYNMTWNQSGINNSTWKKQLANSYEWGNIFNGQSRNVNYTVTSNDNFATILGDMKKLCNVSYLTQAGGATFSGNVVVNNNSYTSPTNNPVVEQNSLTASVEYCQDLGGNVWYWFEKWSDGLTNTSRTDNITEHKNLTAIYKTVPVFHEGRYRNLVISESGGTGSSVKLTWNEHPNTNVTQYQVWRRIKYINGVPQDYTPQHIATVNRGTTQFTDTRYTFAETNREVYLEYDVRAYYAPEGTTSRADWEALWAYEQRGYVEKSAENQEEAGRVTEYSVINYPNPFNPATKINYQLPQAGFTTLKVYDMLGKEVAVLVNEYKNQGSYNVEFDGSSLSSGLYFYELRSNDFVSVKKMMLVR